MHEFLFAQNKKAVANVFMMLKVFVYIYATLVVQSGIVFGECRDGIINQSQVMAWLNYETMAFYLNIIGMGVFLLFSSCKKFRSIRDRVGLGIGQRKVLDYLNYCKDDIHWFCMWFVSLMLCIFALVMRTKDHEKIQMSVGVNLTRHILEVILLRQLYFNTRFEMKSYIKLILWTILGVNVFMIKTFIDLEEEYSVWWGTVFLFDIVLHFFIFF